MKRSKTFFCYFLSLFVFCIFSLSCTEKIEVQPDFVESKELPLEGEVVFSKGLRSSEEKMVAYWTKEMKVGFTFHVPAKTTVKIGTIVKQDTKQTPKGQHTNSLFVKLDYAPSIRGETKDSPKDGNVMKVSFGAKETTALISQAGHTVPILFQLKGQSHWRKESLTLFLKPTTESSLLVSRYPRTIDGKSVLPIWFRGSEGARIQVNEKVFHKTKGIFFKKILISMDELHSNAPLRSLSGLSMEQTLKISAKTDNGKILSQETKVMLFLENYLKKIFIEKKAFLHHSNHPSLSKKVVFLGGYKPFFLDPPTDEKIGDITHIVTSKNIPGRSKKCGPFRRTSNFGASTYGKKMWMNIDLLDLKLQLHDRKGNVLSTKIFRNFQCPTSISMKTKQATLSPDSVWRGWVRKELSRR